MISPEAHSKARELLGLTFHIHRKKPIRIHFRHGKHMTSYVFCMTNWIMGIGFFPWIFHGKGHQGRKKAEEKKIGRQMHFDMLQAAEQMRQQL